MSQVRAVGRTGLLVECRDAAGAAALLAQLESVPPAGLVSVRRGATTVLVLLATPGHASAVRAALEVPAPVAGPGPRGTEHVLDVVYDGEDLDAVAAELGVSRDALVAEHQGAVWHVDFCGFAPGFAYLGGWSRSVRRMASPRARVPAGAVGLAAGWTAAYPGDSPGGWRIVGRTDADLWDVARPAPALLVPGDAVRWRAVRAVARAAFPAERPRVHLGAGPGADPRGDLGAGATARALEVEDPGTLTLVEDLGRGGLEHLGVPASGAADRGAARRVNRLVGNAAGAAVLENVGGLTVVARGTAVVAVTGAAQVSVAGRTVPDGHAAAVGDGERLVATGHGGRRLYVGVAGGLETPEVLGSRSADALSRIAWWPVAAGAVLPLGRATGVVGAPEVAPPEEDRPVRVVLGPRADRFADPGALARDVWRVGADSNRVGARLVGPALAWAADDELLSEPTVPGSIQVPPSGQPVVLLRDHPTTGGYPVVAVVVAEDVDRVARLGAGDTVRFVVAG